MYTFYSTLINPLGLKYNIENDLFENDLLELSDNSFSKKFIQMSMKN